MSSGAAEPLLLALEAATPAASVALLRGDALIAEVETGSEKTLSETLLPCLDRLLCRAELSLDSVDAFAVSIGPGSFTSLRIGIATLKGLALGSPCPAVPVPTLAALALAGRGTSAGTHAGEPTLTVPILDAGRGELYAAAYLPGQWEPQPELPESVYPPDALLARLPEDAILTGERARLPAGIADAGQGNASPAWCETSVGARHVGRLAQMMLRAGIATSPDALVPRYVRRANAEARRTGQPLEAQEPSAPAS